MTALSADSNAFSGVNHGSNDTNANTTEDREMSIATLTEVEIAKLPKELQERVRAIQTSAVAMVEAAKGKFTLKVGAKGGVSLSGFGRYPVTLYREQWEAFIEYLKDGGIAKIEAFIAANASELATKAAANKAAENTNGNGNG